MARRAVNFETDSRVQIVLEALRAGNTRRAAAAYAKIDQNTFYRWLDKGTFRDDVEKAEADAEVRALAIIIRAAQGGTWQAAAWWAERRRPDDYGRRDKLDVTFDARKEAERLAGELDGVSADELVAEAERIASGR